MPDRKVWFGAALGAWNGADVAGAGDAVHLVAQADQDDLDLFTVADHPYFGEKLDAHALVSFLLGRTERISGAVSVTNLPSRPAPVLAGSDWRSTLYRESRPLIDEAAVGAGRDPADIADVFNFGGRITAEPLTDTRGDDGRWIGGSVRQWVDELTGAVLEHRARGFVFRGAGDQPAVDLARWAREIVPAVRAAVADPGGR